MTKSIGQRFLIRSFPQAGSPKWRNQCQDLAGGKFQTTTGLAIVAVQGALAPEDAHPKLLGTIEMEFPFEDALELCLRAVSGRKSLGPQMVGTPSSTRI